MDKRFFSFFIGIFEISLGLFFNSILVFGVGLLSLLSGFYSFTYKTKNKKLQAYTPTLTIIIGIIVLSVKLNSYTPNLLLITLLLISYLYKKIMSWYILTNIKNYSTLLISNDFRRNSTYTLLTIIILVISQAQNIIEYYSGRVLGIVIVFSALYIRKIISDIQSKKQDPKIKKSINHIFNNTKIKHQTYIKIGFDNFLIAKIDTSDSQLKDLFNKLKKENLKYFKISNKTKQKLYLSVPFQK